MTQNIIKLTYPKISAEKYFLCHPVFIYLAHASFSSTIYDLEFMKV